MVALIKTLQVILSISLLVFVHELGHFTFSKLFGVRVDKFFIFFDIKGIALFSTKRTKWFVKLFPKIAASQTEYGIGWLPFGGYCKIAGMVDESMDLESLKAEPKPDELRAHPAWQKLFVMAGGVLFNFIFAIIVFTGIISSRGESYVSNEGSRLIVNELAYDMGFRDGDHIIRYDDFEPWNFGSLQADLARRRVHKAVVLRGTDTLDIYIDRAKIGDVLNTPGMFTLALPFVIDSVPEGTLNAGVGLRHGDKVVAIGGVPVEFVQDSRDILAGYADSTATLSVQRGEENLQLDVNVDSLGRIGVYLVYEGLKQRTYKGLSAIPAGLRFTWETARDYVRDLGLIATPSTQAYKSVGSFIAIGQVFPSTWNWLEFLYIMALLSIMLGVMNLLPIPGLDGGHIVITLFEIITGKKPSDKVMAVLQAIGMVLLIALMMLAFGNDIGRLI